MTIDWQINFDFPNQTLLMDCVHKAMDECQTILMLDAKCQVSILVTDQEKMRRINLETRGIDKVTDVLSFPEIDFRSPFDPMRKPLSSYRKAIIADSGEVFLGDLVLCIERIIEQAADYGHSFEREAAYLTVHGMLHLLGYDHQQDDDQKRMRTIEKQIMKQIGLERMNASD